MIDVPEVIEESYSARVPFDQGRSMAKKDLLHVLEAARWAPTAHNMQNFRIVVIDDRKPLDTIATIEFQVSPVFPRENVVQLCFSEEELHREKIGFLGTTLSAWMRDPAQKAGEPVPLHRLMPTCPAILIMLQDTRKRAPASESTHYNRFGNMGLY